jgi:hypothetical protein
MTSATRAPYPSRSSPPNSAVCMARAYRTGLWRDPRSASTSTCLRASLCAPKWRTTISSETQATSTKYFLGRAGLRHRVLRRGLSLSDPGENDSSDRETKKLLANPPMEIDRGCRRRKDLLPRNDPAHSPSPRIPSVAVETWLAAQPRFSQRWALTVSRTASTASSPVSAQPEERAALSSTPLEMAPCFMVRVARTAPCSGCAGVTRNTPYDKTNG